MRLDFMWKKTDSEVPQRIDDPEVLAKFQEHISHHNFNPDFSSRQCIENAVTINEVDGDETWEHVNLVKKTDEDSSNETFQLKLNYTFNHIDTLNHEKKDPPCYHGMVWVVGYVDYTSKYGLGFLFNTGSVGVYFNDSSKIILSAEGTVFQYIERRRRDAANAADCLIQTHLISRYPLELQKKVTLLKHFKNHLLEQQKKTHKSFRSDANTMTDQCLIKDNVVAEGGTTAIPYGESSTKYSVLPFVTKWVKTKHAIVFIINKRTVQMIFDESSEILFRTDTLVLTYVNKQGMRSEHYRTRTLKCGEFLATLISWSNSDAIERLHYADDLIKLINEQAKDGNSWQKLMLQQPKQSMK